MHVKVNYPDAVMQIREIKCSVKAGDIIGEKLENHIQELDDNITVKESRKSGIERRERILNIQPSSSSDLETRKIAVIARWCIPTMYTERILQKRLQSMLGDGYSLEVNIQKKTVSVTLQLKHYKNRKIIWEMLEGIVPLDQIIDVIIIYNTYRAYKPFTYKKGQSLMADLEMCEKYGFDYIEIRFDCVKDYLKEHTLEELADWFKNHHLKPWAYNTLIFFNQRDEAGEKEIDEEVDFILKVSKAIGMKMLITVPSFDVKDKSVSEIKEEAVARLRYLSDKVGADMKISLEFCGAPNCSINQFGTAYDVVKAVDRDNVGVTVDTFHFHEMCSRLEDLRAADGKKIFAYHLNDCEDLPLGSCGDDKRLWPGEGVVDHAGIAAALKEIGFDGVCTIEEFRPEYYAMSHEDNVKKAAEVTRDFVQKYFG